MTAWIAMDDCDKNSGALSLALKAYYPELDIVIFDLPEVANECSELLNKRIAIIIKGGKLFLIEMLLSESDPRGSLCDLHLLRLKP
jgi:hypothetical protein